MAVVVCCGLSCIKRDVVPVGLAHALASERLRQATTDCSKDLTRSASLASLATSGSLNSLNDDDVGPTKAIDEADVVLDLHVREGREYGRPKLPAACLNERHLSARAGRVSA